MFETLVANVLNKVLGDYVDNLETKQLNIGIWSGKHTLSYGTLERKDSQENLNPLIYSPFPL